MGVAQVGALARRCGLDVVSDAALVAVSAGHKAGTDVAVTGGALVARKNGTDAALKGQKWILNTGRKPGSSAVMSAAQVVAPVAAGVAQGHAVGTGAVKAEVQVTAGVTPRPKRSIL